MMRQKLMQNVIKDLMKVPLKPKSGLSNQHEEHPKQTKIEITEMGHAKKPAMLPGEEDPEQEAEEAISPSHGHDDYEEEELELDPVQHAKKLVMNKAMHAKHGK